MDTIRRILMTFVLCTICIAAKAQLAQFQALYIYNFAKNIGWPPEDASKDLTITVIADNDLVNELNKLAKTKQVGARKVIVKEASNASGIQKSDIIFLGEARSNQIASLISTQDGNKNLIVSAKKGQCAQGACISFMTDGGKLKFEISNKNIAKKGLAVSQKMIQLGTAVD